MYYDGMQDAGFEWDDDKAEHNESNHDVSFMEARSVFLDVNRVEFSMKVTLRRSPGIPPSAFHKRGDCYL